MTMEIASGTKWYSNLAFAEGSKVWVADKESKSYDLGTVMGSSETLEQVLVLRDHDNTEIFTKKVYAACDLGETGYKDMTNMKCINEPQIMGNLQLRSEGGSPYTFMGPVLIAVNPLERVEDPVAAGNPKAAHHPHPYAIAELAYQQMLFTLNRPEENADVPVNQTIVISGESGSGKTVSSKMVLTHIVKRSGGGDDLTKAMLGSNPILESFGNAKTLRNPNSSRFGKLMKVHFDSKTKKIVGASIVTYLLERSRITSHERGERSYHVFYELLHGAGKEILEPLDLQHDGAYNFMLPRKKRQSKSAKLMFKDNDKDNYTVLVESMKNVGIEGKALTDIFAILGAVLHCGNLTIESDSGGSKSKIVQGEVPHLTFAAQLLGLDEKSVEQVFCTKEIESRNETILTFLDEKEAQKNLDGVAKSLYTRLFTWLVNHINTTIGGSAANAEPNYGVLDIFGFETFAKNDFEQLLINYTNEALQQTFNVHVLEREAEIYKREQLALSLEDIAALDPSKVYDKKNSACIDMFQGFTNKETQKKVKGILALIHDEGREISPSDAKLVKKLHKAFGGKKEGHVFAQFGPVHKLSLNEMFCVLHYAGPVNYTVGNFIEKNNDLLPKAVNEIIASSSNEFLKAVWDCGVATSAKASKTSSIVSKFAQQIQDLTSHLNDTQCSFIRCIKPNGSLKKGKGWFNRPYILRQLKSLSILNTADILKCGLPTRIPYAQLVSQYKSIIAKTKIPKFYITTDTDNEVKSFISALFYAFRIERSSYKLGLTRVFFKTGELERLDSVLKSADTWVGKNLSDEIKKEKERVVAEFKKYHLHRRWMVVFAAMRSAYRFIRILEVIRKRHDDREKAAVKIQSTFRMYLGWLELQELLELKLQREAEEAAKQEAIKKREEEARLAAIRERELEEARQKEAELLLKVQQQELENEKQRKKAKQMLEYQKYREEMKRIEAENLAKEKDLDDARAKRLELENQKKAERKKKEREMFERLKEISLIAQKRANLAALSGKSETTSQVDKFNEILKRSKDITKQKKPVVEYTDSSDDSSDSDEDSDSDSSSSEDDSDLDIKPRKKKNKRSFDEPKIEIAVMKKKSEQALRNNYKVQLRRDMLDNKKIMKRAKWADVIVFVYPESKSLLLTENSEKAQTRGKWQCELKKDSPPYIAVAKARHRDYVVKITGLKISFMKNPLAGDKELMLAFKSKKEMTQFISQVEQFVEKKQPKEQSRGSFAKRTSYLRKERVLQKHQQEQLSEKTKAFKMVNLIKQSRAGGKYNDDRIANLLSYAMNEDDDDHSDSSTVEFQVYCDSCDLAYSSTDCKKQKGQDKEAGGLVCPEGHSIAR